MHTGGRSCSAQPAPRAARVTTRRLGEVCGSEIAELRDARDLGSQGGVSYGRHGGEFTVSARKPRVNGPALG